MSRNNSSNSDQQQHVKSVRVGEDEEKAASLQSSPERANISNQNISIISLSKLRNYMPQNQVAARLFQQHPPASSVRVAPLKRSANHNWSAPSPIACYRSNLDAPDQSSSASHVDFNNHEKLASIRALSLKSTQLGSHSGIRSASGKRTTLFHQDSERPTNQVVSQAQLASNQLNSKEQQQHKSTFRKSEGVELAPAKLQDQQQLLSLIEERKRICGDVSRIDLPSTKTKEAESVEEVRQRRDNEQTTSGGCYSRNNMTPSSLLLLQNHNYIEQQQQSRNIANHYANESNHQKQRGEDSSGAIATAAATPVGQLRIEASDARKGDDNQPISSISTQPAFLSSSSSASSSSLMLTNIHQFKALECIGNSSSATSATNISSATSSNASVINSSDYLANQDLNQAHNQLSSADLASTPSNYFNNLQHNHQQSLASSHFKDNSSADASQCINYNATQNSRHINPYHHNFQASMLGQQIKLENVGNERSGFEENNPIVVNQSGQISSSHVDSLNVARNLARQQTRSSIDQYYNQHNLMPPISSSKSSSPASNRSSPSPKTNAMHPNTSQHSNQIASSVCTNPSSSQIHLEHMNNHYMSSNTAESGLNHNHHHQQQHQVNQHYPYTHQATSGSGLHHLSMANHEQAYSHHHQQQLPPSHQQPHSHQHQPQQHQHQQQQHQQQQHQQLQQQQQHHQQHQQQQHQQQHQHQANQQSIYHHLANNGTSMNVNHIYNSGANAQYHAHLQGSSANHQPSHLMQGAHQTHLNSAAAACAAAVVSQTLKTVAHQHSQQHQHGGAIGSSFGSTAGSIMNMTAQHHQQFHSMNQLTHHHHQLGNTNLANQHQQQPALAVHHSANIVTRKYQCKMCPQVFMSKAEMKYHNQNHMREAKPYKCLQCPKAFANSSYLSQHMRIHQGVKPYTCDICSRKFTQLSHLQQHKRTHTGDKPYKCNYMNCTKQFSQLSNLQSHSRCHQLDKPYKCNSCYKCFHDEQSLLEHIPRHLESKHLKKNLCIFCGSSYQQERGLVKHFQQYHTDKKPTLVAAAIAAGTTGNTNLIASLVSSTTANAFATPSSGGSSSSSSSSSSISNSNSVNVHNNLTIVNVAQGASAAFGTNQYC